MPTNAINDTGVKYLYDKLHGEIEPVAEAVSTDKTTVEGNPINFSTKSAQNAESTIIDLEPIQDLHGYSKPWVGGAGKNICDESTVMKGKTYSNGELVVDNNYAATPLIPVKQNTDYVGSFFTKTDLTSGDWIVYNTFDINGDWIEQLTSRYINTGNNVYYIAIRNYQRSSEYIIADNYLYQLEEGSQPTSFAPYSNICPISGRTEIGILGCGKNLANQDGTDTNNGYVHNSFINANGEVQSASGSWDILEYIRVKPSTTYKISGLTVTGVNGYVEYDINKSMVAHGVISSNPFTLVTSANTKYIRINRKYDTDLTVQVEESNQATTYEPYTKSTDLTISLGQTVYGGTFDVENGVLVVDKVTKTINGSDTNDGYGSQSGYYVQIDTMAKLSDYNTSILSDKFITLSDYLALANVDYGISGFKDTNNTYPNQNWIYIKSVLAGSSRNEYRTWLSNNPVQVIYRLATPLEIQLTPNEISLLEGVNNISTDGDKITLTYRDGSVATLGDVKALGDNLTQEIADSQILTDTVTGDKYKLVVSNGVLSIEQISN